MSKFLNNICSMGYSSDSKKKVRDSVNPGESVQTFLTGNKVLDSQECTKLACSLFSWGTTQRRKFMGNVTDSVRHQLLKEGRRIKNLIADGSISYQPDLAWALQNAIDFENSDAEEILAEYDKRGNLPEEVKAWWDSYVKNPRSTKTESLSKSLKSFRVVPVKDDEELDNFLSGKKQEEKLNSAVEESVEGADALSESAQEKLDEIASEVTEKTKDFINSIVDRVKEVIPEVAKRNAVDAATKETEEILEEGEEEPNKDEEIEDKETEEVFEKVGDSISDKDSELLAKKYPHCKKWFSWVREARNQDWRPEEEEAFDYYNPVQAEERAKKYLLSKISDSDEPVISVKVSGGYTDVLVGASVKVSVRNDVFDGTITSTGNGLITISNLPAGFYNSIHQEPADTYSVPLSSVETVSKDVPVDENVDEIPQESLDSVWESIESQYPDVVKVVDALLEEDVDITGGVEGNTVEEAVNSWYKHNSSNLAVNSEVDYRFARFVDLCEALKLIDAEFNCNQTKPDSKIYITYKEKPFLTDTGDTLLVGDTSYIYQIDDIGINSAAKQISIAASSLYEDFLDSNIDEVDDVEVLKDALDKARQGNLPNLCKLQDSEKGFLIQVVNPLSGKVSFVGEDSLVEKDSAKEFLSTSEAYNHLNSLVNEGKLSVSVFYNSQPVEVVDSAGLFANLAKRAILAKAGNEIAKRLNGEVTDSESILTDEVKNDILSKVEGEIVKRLKDKGIEVEDSNLTPKDFGKTHYVQIGSVRYANGDAITYEHQQGKLVIRQGKPYVLKEDGTTYEIDAPVRRIQDASSEVVEKFQEVRQSLSDDTVWDEWQAYASNDVFDKFAESIARDWDTEVDLFLDSDGSTKLDELEIYLSSDALEEFIEHCRRMYDLGKQDEIKDTMDPNEDGDELITVNWDRAKLEEYLNQIKKRSLSKKAKENLHISDSEELTEEQFKELEEKLNSALAILDKPEEVSKLPDISAALKEGAENTYDLSHNAVTFSKVRNTSEILQKVLDLACKIVGHSPISVEEYSKQSDDSRDEKLDNAVADVALSLGDLDLFCSSLYKRKFTDSVWLVDSLKEISDSFNIVIPAKFEDSQAVVSCYPLTEKATKGFVLDSVLEFSYDDNHKLYVAPLKDRI